jgi:hypothetical protein
MPVDKPITITRENGVEKLNMTGYKKERLKSLLQHKGDVILEKQQVEREKKIEIFINEFIKNRGNATEAAMVAFKQKNRQVAANYGNKILKEVRGMAQIYLESKGATYGKLLDTAVAKMEESKTPEWWDRLMKIGGYEDFMTKESKSTGVSVNIIGAQKEFLSGYIEEGEIAEEE